MRVVAVMPAWNEASTIASIVRAARTHGRVVVVDDGSTDDTAVNAREAGALVVRHAVNRGLGAAIGTGIAAARALGADIVYTIDADGQHAPEDIPDILAPLHAGAADVVIGTRFSGKGAMPFRRRMANRIGNMVTAVFFGLRVSDSQSGFRAFTRHALETIRLRTDGMEVSSEIIAEIYDRRLRYTEVPITSIYTVYSLSKGQGFVMGLRTLGRLLLHWTRR